MGSVMIIVLLVLQKFTSRVFKFALMRVGGERTILT